MTLSRVGREAIRLLQEYGTIAYDGTQKGDTRARGQLKAWMLKRVDLMQRIHRQELKLGRKEKGTDEETSSS